LVVYTACAEGMARKAIHETQISNFFFISVPSLAFSLWHRETLVIAPGREVMVIVFRAFASRGVPRRVIRLKFDRQDEDIRSSSLMLLRVFLD
jgi:hypothetical protein